MRLANEMIINAPLLSELENKANNRQPSEYLIHLLTDEPQPQPQTLSGGIPIRIVVKDYEGKDI